MKARFLAAVAVSLLGAVLIWTVGQANFSLAVTNTVKPSKTRTATALATALATATPGGPYPSAPLCAFHSNDMFHTLWNSELGCHYDHEHGASPFTQIVTDTFPGFDLRALLGNVGIGHTNPSSEMENTHKHGGFKWDVTLSHSSGCTGGAQALTGVNAFAVQYHAFGNYAIEFESRVHSAAILMRQCQAGNPTDYGYMYVVQHQDYGQRVAPYQGVVLPYPDTPGPAYPAARNPYLSVTCFSGIAPCNKFPTLQYILNNNRNTDTTWISAPGNGVNGSTLFSLLFRARDTYQALDWNDQTYPFTFAWLCSADGGATYSSGCRYNNTTTRVHELHGTIPEAWDNLAGFDSDARVGRITSEGYVTRFGDLALECIAPDIDCHPIKLIGAFSGPYTSAFALVAGKASFAPENLPERDVYFCAGLPCTENAPGAVPSGWLGSEN